MAASYAAEGRTRAGCTCYGHDHEQLACIFDHESAARVLKQIFMKLKMREGEKGEPSCDPRRKGSAQLCYSIEP